MCLLFVSCFAQQCSLLPTGFCCSENCIAALCLSVLCLRGWLFHGEKEFSCFIELHVAIFPSNICYTYGVIPPLHWALQRVRDARSAKF